jgi:hypothetical protein
MDLPARSWGSSPWRTRSSLILLVGIVLFFGFSFHDHHNTPAATKASPISYTYECCRDSGVDTVYRPGEILRLQWIRVAQASGQSGLTSHATFTLHASLSGPFSSVAMLKTTSASSSAPLGSTGITAAPLEVSGKIASSPVSLIRIPLTAGSGYFNLSFRESSGAWSVGSATIIRVKS